MAYEQRRLLNNLSGTLAARASATDQQITCQGSAPGVSNVFAALPTDFSSTLYMPLVLANDATGKFEIVWVTGHSSASPTLTVVRNREGTDAQTFEVGDVVRCAATTRDLSPMVVATRTALPADPHLGLRALILDEAAVVIRSPFGWQDDTPGQGNPKRKRHWVQTGVSVPHGTALSTVSGLAAAGNDPGAGFGSLTSGLFVPGVEGEWSLSWQVSYSNVNNVGMYYQQMSWVDGAFPLGSQKGATAHHSAGGAVRGNTILPVEWSGYVSAAQAQKPITLQTLQNNDAAVAVNGAQFDFTAEYKGR